MHRPGPARCPTPADSCLTSRESQERERNRLVEIRAAQAQRTLAPLPPLPPGYPAMSSQEQMRADLKRRCAQLAAPVDLEVIEAEIID